MSISTNFNELNAKIANVSNARRYSISYGYLHTSKDWDIQPDFYQRYTPPPDFQGFSLEQGAHSYFPADENPNGGQKPFDVQHAAAVPQYPVQDQYAAADPQYAVNFQYPVHDQYAAVEALLSEADMDSFIQNNPEFFQQVEGAIQIQIEDAQQMVSPLSKVQATILLTYNRTSPTIVNSISPVKRLKRLHTILIW
jgi:hypothetical protein